MKREQDQIKRDVISRVSVAAMRILENSYIFGSRIWPTDGLKMGNGLSLNPKECIFMGINAYGILNNPVIGVLCLYPTTNSDSRERSQKKHLRLILDYAICDNIIFENESRNTTWFDQDLRFKFTINK